MTKTSLERLFLQNPDCKKLLESAGGCECDGNPPAVERVASADPCAASCERTSSTEGDDQPKPGKVTFSTLATDRIDSMLPALQGKADQEILKIAAELYRKSPSANRIAFLEAAVNRALITLDKPADVRRVIEIAAVALKEGALPKPDDVRPKDYIWTWLHEHKTFAGKSLFVAHANWEMYKQVRGAALRQAHLHDEISSLTVNCGPPPEVQGDVILFEHDRYEGRYYRVSAAAAAMQETAYVGNQFNDKASSILMVRHWTNEVATPLGSVFSRDVVADIVRQQPRVRNLRGDPIFTWDMFPEGGGRPGAPDRAFVYVKIPIRIDVPNWFDYDAEVRYWIGLWVDATGALQARVEWYGCWVEGGIISGRVADDVMARLPATLALVDGQLAMGLPTVNAFGPYEMVYLLPGENAVAGHTNDDVTVVLVRSQPQSGDTLIL